MSEKRDHERVMFEHFLKVEPEFCGEAIREWYQPEDERDFPDIKATTTTGRNVGIEIGEWLNEQEMAEAKRKERREDGILGALGDLGENPTKHVRSVWLHPKEKARISEADAAVCRAQLVECILAEDRKWTEARRAPEVLSGDGFAAYPLVGKYFDAVKLFAAGGRDKWKTDWITFPLLGRVFGKETMFKPLRELVSDKTRHYSSARTGFDSMTLLIVYNRAAIYNSPADTPMHTYEQAAAELRSVIDENRGPFDRAFLFIAIGEGRALRVC